MRAINPGDSFRFVDGSVVNVLAVRNVPRYVGGETQTRAGREPVRIRMDDATVYDCESGGVQYVNSAAEMAAVASNAEAV